MSSRNIAAIHDRIDEEHFELRLHDSAIRALQERVNLLEAAVSQFRQEWFGKERPHAVRRNRTA